MTTATKLTTFVPELAAELKMPDMLVHMWCRQEAIAKGITWGMDLASKDADTIRAAVMAKHGDSHGKMLAAQQRARARRK